jgi:hypothetical protein
MSSTSDESAASERMKQALDAIISKGIAVREASRKFRVPRSTLQRKVNIQLASNSTSLATLKRKNAQKGKQR